MLSFFWRADVTYSMRQCKDLHFIIHLLHLLHTANIYDPVIIWWYNSLVMKWFFPWRIEENDIYMSEFKIDFFSGNVIYYLTQIISKRTPNIDHITLMKSLGILRAIWLELKRRENKISTYNLPVGIIWSALTL